MSIRIWRISEEKRGLHDRSFSLFFDRVHLSCGGVRGLVSFYAYTPESHLRLRRICRLPLEDFLILSLSPRPKVNKSRQENHLPGLASFCSSIMFQSPRR